MMKSRSKNVILASMNKFRLATTAAIVTVVLALSGCGSTEVESSGATESQRETPAPESTPAPDPRAEHYIAAVNRNWETCWPLIADDVPVLTFRPSKKALREGYVDVKFIAETLSFEVGKWGDGSDSTIPDSITDFRVEKAGCYD